MKFSLGKRNAQPVSARRTFGAGAFIGIAVGIQIGMFVQRTFGG